MKQNPAVMMLGALMAHPDLKIRQKAFELQELLVKYKPPQLPTYTPDAFCLMKDQAPK